MVVVVKNQINEVVQFYLTNPNRYCSSTHSTFTVLAAVTLISFFHLFPKGRVYFDSGEYNQTKSSSSKAEIQARPRLPMMEKVKKTSVPSKLAQ